MRSTISTLAVLFLFLTGISCSSDTGDAPVVAEEQEKELEIPLPDPTEPCDFVLTDLKANETKTIDCKMDLQGETLVLPSGVSLVYDGGSIENGTLEFSGGKIDGPLLNQSLKLEGEVSLKNPVFKFIPKNWSIHQGSVDGGTALNNRLELEKLMGMVKALGATSFSIDEFDAFFEVVTVTDSKNPNFYPNKEAINIPSDFNLLMTENTHLRVFPNASPKYSLLAFRDVQNSSVTGGVLHGDRDEHEYTEGSSHEWGHLITVKASKNISISGVTMKNGSGDGMDISSLNFFFQDNYIASENITVTDCVFDSNRRNNLSITDGKDIVVENSTFLRAGVDTPDSKGTNPRLAIDIEVYTEEHDGERVYYEKVDGVVIRNNVEKGSSNAGFLVSIGGDNVTLEENTVETGILYARASGTIIRNNRITAKTIGNGRGIKAGQRDVDTNTDNQVYGNTVVGYDMGIQVNGPNNKVYNNTIINCKTGIGGRDASDSEIYENTITSDNEASRGIFFYVGGLDRVSISKNKIDTPNNPIKFEKINIYGGQEDYSFSLSENEIRSDQQVVLLTEANGALFKENQIFAGTQIWNSSSVTFDQNTIKADNRDGILLTKENIDITLKNNNIQVDSDMDCIKLRDTTDESELTQSNNSCVKDI